MSSALGEARSSTCGPIVPTLEPMSRLEGWDRARLGRMHHPVRGILHGTAAIGFSAAGVLLLVLSRGDWGHKLALAIFGLSLTALYTVSAMYHSIPWKDRWKARMQRLDHSMIFVLIAGSYTPLAFILFEGWLRWATLAVQWTIVAVGVTHKMLWPRVGNGFSIPLQVTQGWLAVLLLVPLAQHLPEAAIALIAAGGVLYTVGMVLVVTGWPRLWPRTFSYHEVFHVLVVSASVLHFTVVAVFVAPLT